MIKKAYQEGLPTMRRIIEEKLCTFVSGILTVVHAQQLKMPQGARRIFFFSCVSVAFVLLCLSFIICSPTHFFFVILATIATDAASPSFGGIGLWSRWTGEFSEVVKTSEQRFLDVPRDQRFERGVTPFLCTTISQRRDDERFDMTNYIVSQVVHKNARSDPEEAFFLNHHAWPAYFKSHQIRLSWKWS